MLDVQELNKKVINILRKLGYKENGTQKVNILPLVDNNEILSTLQKGKIISENIENDIVNLKEEQLIYYNDIEKNEFSIFEQKPDSKILPNYVVFINDIPIILVQLANELNFAKATLSRNFNFILQRKEIFRTVQLIVAIGNDGISYRLSRKNDGWKVWNTTSLDTSRIEDRIESFFKKDTLLDILKNYIIENKNYIILASYYQYFSTKQILLSKERENKVCYAAGTGKNTSILFLISNLYKKNRFAKILLIVDRIDEQNFFEKMLKTTIKSGVEVAITRQKLEGLLNNIKPQIVITTLQKLIQYDSKNLGEMYIISDVKDLYEEDYINELGKKIFPNSVLIKYSNLKNKEENVLYSYTEQQALKDGLRTDIFYVTEGMQNKQEINLKDKILKDSKDNKESSIIQTSNNNKENNILQTSKYNTKDADRKDLSLNIENNKESDLVKNIGENALESKKNYEDNSFKSIVKDIIANNIKKEQIIIYTRHENCIKYVEELSKFKTVATTSVLKYMIDNDTIQDLERENGTLENYVKESLKDFNSNNLEVLVVSSFEELQEITTSNVTKIYLDKTINIKLLQQMKEILSKKAQNKDIGIIIDFAKNDEIISNYKKESKLVEDISILINKTRVLLVDLVSRANKIESKLQTILSINDLYTIVEIEEYKLLVKSLIEKLFFIFSSERQTEKIPESERKVYKESIVMILKLLDKISVIYAIETENINDIENLCEIMGIEKIQFTKISKGDLAKYPNLDGIWKELTSCQKIEAIKSRLKIYMGDEEKDILEKILNKYKEGKIDELTYCNYIKKAREKYINQFINKNLPIEIKSSEFSKLLYENLESKTYMKTIIVNSQENLIKLILNLKNSIEENLKVGWRQNLYLRKKIKLNIIEELYNAMEKQEIFIPDKLFDILLSEIEKIALKTLDVINLETKDKYYYIKKKNAYAMAKKVEDKFLVLKNSTTVEGYSRKMNEGYLLLAKELREKEIIKDNRFTQDYLFNSSSAAANVILGRSSNGKIEWKDDLGKTLSESEA